MLKKTNQGFTLIEILLSLLVFALLSMATYSVLNSTIEGKEAIVTQTDSLTQLQRVFTIMDNDISQFAQRKARINGEAPGESFFLTGEFLNDSESEGFSFVRDGWVNPLMILPRSELQLVAYRIIENKLERLYYNHVDNDVGSEPRVQTLLEGVTALSVSLQGEDEDDGSSALPRIISITITTDTYGEIERLFSIPAIVEKQDEPDND